MMGYKMKRVIFIEPNIDESIKDLFKKYNPDSSFVNPHICLVFPFESELCHEDIKDIMYKVLFNLKPFNIKLNGISISYEEKNNFIFLNVIDDNNMLYNISNLLYKELDGYAKLKGDYNPHITIIKNKDKKIIDSIKKKIDILKSNTWKVKIDKIYSKIIIKDNDNITLQDEIEYELDRDRK